MTELKEDFAAMREASRRLRLAREERAEQEYQRAQRRAREHGLSLHKQREWHYTLMFPKGNPMKPQPRVEVYPQKQRVYSPPHISRPFLVLPEDRDWGLLDVVDAAIRAVGEDHREGAKDAEAESTERT